MLITAVFMVVYSIYDSIPLVKLSVFFPPAHAVAGEGELAVIGTIRELPGVVDASAICYLSVHNLNPNLVYQLSKEKI